MSQDNFSGRLLLPNVDFGAVRDGRRSPLFHYDVDLSVAHSVALGNPVILSVAGDSFYVDKNPSLIGSATVHFQDTTFGSAPAPVFCEPGFIAKVPFTQLLIENTAQPGKIFRFHYGVAIDFTPGASSSVNINGNVMIVPPSYTGAGILTPLVPGPNVIIPPASNVAGIILSQMNVGTEVTVNGLFSVIARNAPPANISDADVIGTSEITCVTGAARTLNYRLPSPVSIPAGKGIYVYVQAGTIYSLSLASAVYI